MRRDTFEAVLRQFNSAAPFSPFTIELVNKVRLISRHPEATILRGDLAVHADVIGNAEYFDASSVARVVSVIIPPGAD